jgi:hypothetical protein
MNWESAKNQVRPETLKQRREYIMPMQANKKPGLKTGLSFKASPPRGGLGGTLGRANYQ